jgi:hypothetical protein
MRLVSRKLWRAFRELRPSVVHTRTIAALDGGLLSTSGAALAK